MTSARSNGPRGQFDGLSAEQILACIGDAVISTDRHGKIMLVNPAAETLFGYPAGGLLGSSILRLVPARFRESQALHIAAFGQVPGEVAGAVTGERGVVGLRRDGTEFRAEATLSRRFIGRKALLTLVIRDVSQQSAREAQRNLIASESAHRFKNVMAVINAVISLTARSVCSVEEFRDALEDRLRSISRTQEALLGPWNEVQLTELVQRELAPFLNDPGSGIRIHGPDLTVPPQQAISTALVLHELATNAAKYGSLSTRMGYVQLQWTEDHEGAARYLLLDWIEIGGPPVVPPVRRGFGSDLIRRCFGPAGSVIHFNPEGLSAHFRIPL